MNSPSAPRSRPARKTLPVALLVEGRRCLVVGGGTVAGRKAEALLNAGAAVTLVAPRLGASAEALRARDRFQILPRTFEPADLAADLFLVIAATDDPALNRSLLTACQARGLLCACPDTGWEQGDFISPASFQHGDLTVSVSTGGAACRRSRLIKDSLARHAEALGQADLWAVGVDHRATPLALREPLHLAGSRLEQVGNMLGQLRGLHEFMLVATCNRIELIGLAAATPALDQAVRRILGFDSLGDPVYSLAGREAFRHLALMVSGLLSQIPGETHICAQVKTALDHSAQAGWSAGVLRDWIGTALHIGKAIRQILPAPLTGSDIEDRCLAFLERQGGPLAGRPVLVIGSGALGTGLVERFAARGARVTCCYHSRPPRFTPAAGTPIALVPLAGLDAALPAQEILVGAAQGTAPLLTADHARRLAPDRPVWVVDLGVPRNVAPDFMRPIPGLHRADLDDIKRFDAEAAGPLLNAARLQADRLIEEHQTDYDRIRSSIQGGN